MNDKYLKNNQSSRTETQTKLPGQDSKQGQGQLQTRLAITIIVRESSPITAVKDTSLTEL